jgi:hypothetical protein
MEALSFLVKFLFAWLVLAPLCTCLHEIGHAGLALLLTDQQIRFQLGSKGKKLKLDLGRLTITLFFEPMAIYGLYQLEDKTRLTFKQDLWITLGGPLMSLLLTILFASLAWTSGWATLWTILFIINLIAFLNTAFPWTYPNWQGIQAGIPSDGRQILKLLYGK